MWILAGLWTDQGGEVPSGRYVILVWGVGFPVLLEWLAHGNRQRCRILQRDRALYLHAAYRC